MIKAILGYFVPLFMGILIGYSARPIFPNKFDKKIDNNNYLIACLDGQISVLEVFTKQKPFQQCADLRISKARDKK